MPPSAFHPCSPYGNRVAASTSGAGSGAAAPPPLPRVALETFPPAARDAVSTQLTGSHRASSRRRRRAGRSAGCCTHGSSGTPRTRRMRAPPSWRLRLRLAYLDAVVLQRLARHARRGRARSAARSPRGRITLPAQAEARRSPARSRRARGERTAVRFRSRASPRPRTGGGSGARPHHAAIEGRHEEAIRHFERAVELFPELGAAHYALARAYRAARPHRRRRARRRGSTPGSARAGRDSTIPCSPPSPRCARTHGRPCAGRRAWLKTETSGRHRGARGGARARSLADAGACESGRAVRSSAANWAKAEEHYRAAAGAGLGQTPRCTTTTGSCSGLQEKWEAAAGAYRKALAANPLHAAGAEQSRTDPRARGAISTGRANEYRQAVEAQPTFRLARFNLGRMLLVQRRRRSGDRRIREAAAAGRCGNAALSLCAIDSARPRGQDG